MGCITSRPWPPKPYKRPVIRWERRLVKVGDEVVARIVEVEDYVIDWPSLRCCGAKSASRDDTSPWQETAIRHMEEG